MLKKNLVIFSVAGSLLSGAAFGAAPQFAPGRVGAEVKAAPGKDLSADAKKLADQVSAKIGVTGQNSEDCPHCQFTLVDPDELKEIMENLRLKEGLDLQYIAGGKLLNVTPALGGAQAKALQRGRAESNSQRPRFQEQFVAPVHYGDIANDIYAPVRGSHSISAGT